MIESGIEILSFGQSICVGMSRYHPTEECVAQEVGDDWLKFHFQLRGAARYSVPGERPLMIDDLTFALALHGQGIVKSGCIAPGPAFAVTILCKPDILTDRFGMKPGDMPGPVSRFLEQGEAAWFSEVGRMTPSMAMSVRALEAMAFEGPMRRAYVEARGAELICELWTEIAGSAARAVPRPDERTLTKVERTRDYIDTHFSEPLAVQSLARNVGASVTRLSEAFRTVFGITIFEYVRSRRMEEARRLLRAGRLSVTEIAFDVGYEHSCNFSVAYKRHFGITPREERTPAVPH
ncbi:helix-turn-helix transcriptional regulator [Sphingosinicella rhizophila]|uniref:AraC family transcriptional regulator n=1 Tax=Sphingosinicella rhizophila TaxID=3050082 RepID=A0ABU3QAW5_9SPHN|nr:AraC family transcriptional regulator [Sphingosinicella sp. GR2756]MDT9600511.1 AraC family transcriptional regulator [Sphingosinicella sp. GR2756]